MKATITSLVIVLFLVSCSSVKRNQKMLNSGNYSEAVEFAIKKIQKDKVNFKNDPHVVLLEESFAKATEEDIRQINYLKKENNPANARRIYFLYQGLEWRQQMVRPLLPLYSNSLGRNVKFEMVNYSDAILKAKDDYVVSLYNEAQRFMNRNTILDYRTAYNVLCELDELQPNYKDVIALKDEARFLGINFVLVSLKNHSYQILPYRLEQELLDFNTYGLDDFWSEYHNRQENGINYKYGITLNFQKIDIAPERISEMEYSRKQTIKDGWEYKKDRNGNIVKDSLGNNIKIDKYITVTAKVRITEQTKAVYVGGNVVYFELDRQREINSYPLASEFIFENVFATYRGDDRALTAEDRRLVNNRFIPFPDNAQMLLDAGEDVKARLKDILKRNSLN